MKPAFLQHYDLALISLYLFWAFFAGLVLYLHRESKREGYPLITDRLNDRVQVVGFPGLPAPKTYTLADGSTVTTPNLKREQREIKLQPTAGFFGASHQPTGDPLADGVGPASYAERADVPDVAMDGQPRMRLISALPDFHLDERDPNPIGMEVYGADRSFMGTVRDLWVDRAESVLRYFEVERPGGSRVVVPYNFTTVDARLRRINVEGMTEAYVGGVPAPRTPGILTRLEEDKITAYYGGSLFYRPNGKMGPLL
jgi:photosynthetic reaction center H subunit